MVNNVQKAVLGFASADANSWNIDTSDFTKPANWYRYMKIGDYSRVEEIEEGEYSDYTQLLLCSLRARQYSNWYSVLAFNELPLWTSYKRETDQLMRVACTVLSNRSFPWQASQSVKEIYYNGFSELSIVRGLAHLADDTDDVFQFLSDVYTDTILTHGSPFTVIASCLASYFAFVLNKYAEGKIGLTALESLDKEFLVSQLEEFIGIFCMISNFDSPCIKSYLDGIIDRESFNNSWTSCIFILSSWVDYLKANSLDTITALKDCTGKAGLNHELLNSIILAMILLIKSKGDTHITNALIQSALVNRHLLATLHGAYEAMLGINIYSKIGSLLSVGYIIAISDVSKHKSESPVLDMRANRVRDILSTLPANSDFNVPYFGHLKVLQSGNSAQDEGMYCSTTICCKNEDTQNNQVFVFYSERFV